MALSIDDLQRELDNLKNAASGAATGVSQFGQALSGQAGGLGTFNKALQGGAQIAGSALGQLGPLGQAAATGLNATSKMLGVSLDQIDRLNRTYMTLGNTGQSLGETQSSLRELGGQFGLAIGLNEEAAQRFAKVLTANSKDLARLGGTAVMGSRRLGEAFEAMGPVRVALQNIGISYEEQIEGLADYTRMQTATGRAQRMTTEQLAQGSADYLRKLQDLANVTGVSRQEQAKVREAALAEQRYGAYIISERMRADKLEAQGRTEEAAAIRKNIEGLQEFTGVVGNMDAELAKGLRDIAAGAQTEEAKKARRTLGGDADVIVRGLKQGTMTSAQALQRLGNAADRGVKSTVALARVSDSYGRTYTDITKLEKIAQLGRNDIAQKSIQAERDRIKAEKDLTSDVSRTNVVSNKARQAQVEFGRALEGTQDAALSAADAIGTKMVEVLPSLVDGFNQLAGELTNAVTGARTFGEFLDALGKSGSKILSDTGATGPSLSEDVSRAREAIERNRANAPENQRNNPARSDVIPLTTDQIQALKPPAEPVVRQVKIAADQLPALRTTAPPVQQVKIAADQLKDLKLPGLATPGFGEQGLKMPASNDMIRSQAADITRKYMDLVGDVGLNTARDTMENFRFPDLDTKMPDINVPNMTEMLTANKANIMRIKMPGLDLPSAPAAGEMQDQNQQMQDQFQNMMDQVNSRPQTNDDQPLLAVMNEMLNVQRQQSATMMKMLQVQRN